MCSALTSLELGLDVGGHVLAVVDVDLDLVVLIWASMVSLSAAETSVPSLIALRKVGGVMRSRPSAGASIAKIDSDAPTGVPAYLALMAAISVVVRLQGDGVEPRRLRREVGAVGRVERLEVVDHLERSRPGRRRGLYQRWGLPPSATPSRSPTFEHGRVALVGGQQLRHPRVVPDAVLDHELGVGQRPRRRTRSARSCAGRCSGS